MGREIKRVPIDFDWPLGKVWQGFQNPYYQRCPACQRGQTASLNALEQLCRVLSLAADDSRVRPPGFKPPVRRYQGHDITVAESREMEIQGRRQMYPHPYCCDAGIEDPGDDLWKVVAGLYPGAKFETFSNNCYGVLQGILRAAGLPEAWGQCPVCQGDGLDPKVKQQCEAWEPTDPPPGDGWQLWETVSEGSPISPVFGTPEELIDYMASTPSTPRSIPWNQGYSRAAAEAFVKGPGWAPSGVGIPGKGFVSGVEALALIHKEEPDAQGNR